LSDDDSVAGFSFLASDREDEEDSLSQSGLQSSIKRKAKSTGKEIQTHVFTRVSMTRINLEVQRARRY
jgi:hypothetical protein